MEDNKFSRVVLEETVLPLTGMRLTVSEQGRPEDTRGNLCVVACEFVYHGQAGRTLQCFYPDEINALKDGDPGAHSARIIKLQKLMVLRQMVDKIAQHEGFLLEGVPLNTTAQGNPVP
jgi:hypothetical protein